MRSSLQVRGDSIMTIEFIRPGGIGGGAGGDFLALTQRSVYTASDYTITEPWEFVVSDTSSGPNVIEIDPSVEEQDNGIVVVNPETNGVGGDTDVRRQGQPGEIDDGSIAEGDAIMFIYDSSWSGVDSNWFQGLVI